ncbi:uncharacterized mitochondrial protein-like protein, partial [Tanacetum coccineum]
MVKPIWKNAQRVNHQNFAKKTHPYAKKNLVPRAVLMKSGLVSINTARQVNVAHSKTTVNAARLMSYLSKSAHSTVKMPIHKNTTFKNSNINQKVNIVRGKKFNTARPKAAVNAVNGNNYNAVKASAFYMDDIIFDSTKKELCFAFEKLMHEKFQMSSMGELTFFLGLQVKQKKDDIFISQDKYVEEILKKFRFTEVKTTSTPMETQKHLLKDEYGEEVNVYMYRSMIGSLMYLTSSRPDIMFVVCACTRYQVNPNVSHIHVVKKIF